MYDNGTSRYSRHHGGGKYIPEAIHVVLRPGNGRPLSVIRRRALKTTHTHTPTRSTKTHGRCVSVGLKMCLYNIISIASHQIYTLRTNDYGSMITRQRYKHEKTKHTRAWGQKQHFKFTHTGNEEGTSTRTTTATSYKRAAARNKHQPQQRVEHASFRQARPRTARNPTKIKRACPRITVHQVRKKVSKLRTDKPKPKLRHKHAGFGIRRW